MTHRHRLPATRAMDRIAGNLGNPPQELRFKSLLAHRSYNSTTSSTRTVVPATAPSASRTAFFMGST